MSFSAWGERRLPNDWADMQLPSLRDYLSDYTTQGFTGHEMLDTFGIVNMGGRIYDAALGRVLQADPFVQEPTNSQSYNRHTYVFNNPLSYTDPSGFITLRQVLGVVAGVLLSWFNPFALNVFWSAFVAGFTGSIIITGNLKSAIKAGIIAGALAFAGDAIFGKGTGNDTADPTAATDGGAGQTTTTTASESTNLASNSAPSSTEAALGQTSVQSVNQTSTQIADNIVGASPGGAVDPNAIHLGTYAPQFDKFGNVFRSYLLDEAQLLTGLMVGSISAQLANAWSQDARYSDDNPRNLSKLADDIDRINTQHGYVKGVYDQRIYTGLEIADKISMASGVVGLARGIAFRQMKAIVIGEGMGAVKVAAKNLQAQGVNAKWYQAWGKNFPSDRMMTNLELDQALARNRRWLISKVKKDYKIYDIGVDPLKLTRSPFYQLEKQILKEFNYSVIKIGR